MLLNDERQKLLAEGKLKTNIARELYEKYYHLLFEFASDLENSNVREILIRDNSVVIRTRNENMLLNCPPGEMTAAMGQLILAGTENDEQEMMSSLLKQLLNEKNSDAVFFDIGANIGWYSIYFSRLFPELKIHAFEPIKFTYEELLKNLSLNDSGPVQTENIGFADRNESVEFHVSPSVIAASSLADTCQIPDKIKVPGEIRKMDTYCKETGVAPDFIKCDVEGAELLVFSGAENVLSESKPLVMTELLRKWAKCFDYHPNDVLNLFKKHNYSCFIIDQGRLKAFDRVTDDTRETNYFFLHNEKHQHLFGFKVN